MKRRQERTFAALNLVDWFEHDLTVAQQKALFRRIGWPEHTIEGDAVRAHIQLIVDRIEASDDKLTGLRS